MKTVALHSPITQQTLTILSEYIDDLSLSKSDLTVSAYSYDITKFLEFISEKGIKRVSSIKPSIIVAYLSSCKGVKSASTVNRYFMSIRSFCAFLRKRKHVAEDLTQDISIPAAKQKAPRILTIQEIEKLLNQPENLRDKAILELLYSSGLCASELCDLSLEDLGQDNIRVVCGKRGKTRTVPMTQAAIRAIEAYVQERGKEEGYLFLTLNRKHSGGK